MEVTVLQTASQLDEAAADLILKQIADKPDSVIGLSTGRTTGSIHRAVTERCRKQPLDLSKVTFFGIDEVTHVPKDYAGACYTMLKTEIIDPLEVQETHFLMLPTESPDFGQACREFTEALRKRGGIDLLFLGLGENGHLGFNQPGAPFGSTAWVSVMYPELEARIRRETRTPEGVPLGGVTLGIKDIMLSRSIVLAAKGPRKAAIVQKMIQGPVTEDVPASVLQLHPFCTILLDSDAASKLQP